MYIEKVFKLKLKPDEAELLKKCEALLEDILHNFKDDYLGDVQYDDIDLAADVLQRLYDGKEFY